MLQPVIAQVNKIKGRIEAQINSRFDDKPWMHQLKNGFKKGQAEVVQKVELLKDRADTLKTQAEEVGKEALVAAYSARKMVIKEVNEMRGSTPAEIKEQAAGWFKALRHEVQLQSKTVFKKIEAIRSEGLMTWLSAKKAKKKSEKAQKSKKDKHSEKHVH